MQNINIQALADILKISKSTVSKALKDSHEISDETKRSTGAGYKIELLSQSVMRAACEKRKAKRFAVVMPEVADSFFSLIINGIQSVAEKKDTMC